MPNGIAYDIKSDSFWLTGKMWDFAFNVQLNYKEAIDFYVEQEYIKSELWSIYICKCFIFGDIFNVK